MPNNETPADITEVACWREAREFVNLVYSITSQEAFSKDSLLVELLRRHSISVMAKISDGYHRRNKEVFLGNLEEAKGFLGEAISHLYVAFDQEYLNHDELNDALNKGYTVGIRINSHLKSLQEKSG